MQQAATPTYDGLSQMVSAKNQKSNKNNPNKDRLIAAAKKMIADPESQKIIDERVGKYPWLVGGEVNQAYDQLYKNLSKKNLENLVWWTQNAVKMEASLKPEIVNKAAK